MITYFNSVRLRLKNDISWHDRIPTKVLHQINYTFGVSQSHDTLISVELRTANSQSERSSSEIHFPRLYTFYILPYYEHYHTMNVVMEVTFRPVVRLWFSSLLFREG